MANSKKFTIFAGINGAGKSTLYYTLGAENFGFRINSDEYIRDHGYDWRSRTDQFLAGKAVLKLQEECLNQGISFNRETTVPGYSIVRAITKAKKLNYKINLKYVGIDNLETAKKRIAERVQRGGHGIGEEVVEARFAIIKSELQKIMPLCDSIELYDNSKDAIQLVTMKQNDGLVKIKDCKWAEELIDEYELMQQNIGNLGKN